MVWLWLVLVWGIVLLGRGVAVVAGEEAASLLSLQVTASGSHRSFFFFFFSEVVVARCEHEWERLLTSGFFSCLQSGLNDVDNQSTVSLSLQQ